MNKSNGYLSRKNSIMKIEKRIKINLKEGEGKNTHTHTEFYIVTNEISTINEHHSSVMITNKCAILSYARKHMNKTLCLSGSIERWSKYSD